MLKLFVKLALFGLIFVAMYEMAKLAYKVLIRAPWRAWWATCAACGKAAILFLVVSAKAMATAAKWMVAGMATLFSGGKIKLPSRKSSKITYF